MTRFRLVLLIVGVTLAFWAFWRPGMGDGIAASVAHSYCSTRPQPEACKPDGRPDDALAQFLGIKPSSGTAP